MKKILLLIISALFGSCAPNISITGSWKKTPPPIERLHSVFIAALSNDILIRSYFERDLSARLQKAGCRTVLAIDEFPPGFLKDSTDRGKLLLKMKEKNLDAILTLSILKKENDFRYVPGACAYTPMMYVHYHHFWGYYSYWYPCVYEPGYYVKDEIYFIEANLYSADNEELIWSAQSQTYNNTSLSSVSQQFARAIVTKMSYDGILPGKKTRPVKDGVYTEASRR